MPAKYERCLKQVRSRGGANPYAVCANLRYGARSTGQKLRLGNGQVRTVYETARGRQFIIWNKKRRYL